MPSSSQIIGCFWTNLALAGAKTRNAVTFCSHALMARSFSQDLKEQLKMFAEGCTQLLSQMPKPAAGSSTDPLKERARAFSGTAWQKEPNSPSVLHSMEKQMMPGLKTLRL